MNVNKIIYPLAFAILGLFIFSALFASILAPYDPNLVDMSNIMAGSSSTHLLGTDHLGRDLLSRLIYGGQSSVFIAFFATGCSLTIGLVIGIISGFFGGILDHFTQGIVTIFQGIPNTVFVIAILGILGTGIENLLIAIIIGSWANFSRVVRNLVLEVREHHYIEGAKALGAGKCYIMVKHIFPNIIPQLLVLIARNIGSTVLTVASMSFLGLGLQAPASDWGIMINDARSYYFVRFILILAPALCLTLFCLSINLISDYLRDYMDNDHSSENML